MQLQPQLQPFVAGRHSARTAEGPATCITAGHGPSSWRRMGDSNPRGLAPNTLSNCVFRCSWTSTNVYLRRSKSVADDDRRRSTPANTRELQPKLQPAGDSPPRCDWLHKDSGTKRHMRRPPDHTVPRGAPRALDSGAHDFMFERPSGGRWQGLSERRRRQVRRGPFGWTAYKPPFGSSSFPPPPRSASPAEPGLNCKGENDTPHHECVEYPRKL